MTDRQPTYPGRVTLTPVAGQEDTFDMVMADQPTDPGTPPTKDNLFSDATALKYPNCATVDAALGVIGNYNLYWWKRRTSQLKYAVNVATNDCTSGGQIFNMFSTTAAATYITIYYADSVSVDQSTGAILLNNATAVSVRYSNAYDFTSTFSGKYISELTDGTKGVWKISVSASCRTDSDSGYYGWMYYPAYIVSSYSYYEYGEWEYLQSTLRNAYPDSGISSGYEYQYLGIPFTNAVNASRVAHGSYKGTGTYGIANKNSLTFDFTPKIVFIDSNLNGLIVVNGCASGNTSAFDSGQSGVSISWETNSVSWYSSSSASYQLNGFNNTYNYAAIG